MSENKKSVVVREGLGKIEVDKIVGKNKVDKQLDKIDAETKSTNLKSEKDKKLNKKNNALSDALRKNLIRRKDVKGK